MATSDDTNPCADCAVVHVQFGGSNPGRREEQAPLTNAELAGLREIFRSCPAAKRALARVVEA